MSDVRPVERSREALPGQLPLAGRPAEPTREPRALPAALAKGFRPFFLLAAVYAALFLPIWLAITRGVIAPAAYLGGTYWHAHEMIFGYTLAVIAGFLLTAVGNWTQRETAAGGALGALAGLWVAGRLAVLFADRLPRLVPAVVDLAFLPALALACLRPMLASSNRRNYPFVGMLLALFAANLWMHLGALGIGPAGMRHGAWLAVHVITVMILVMSARVVPMFTRNATRVQTIRNLPALDAAAVVGMLAVTALDAVAVAERVVGVAAALTGLAVLARAVFWGGQHTLRTPLLWVLHAGNAFVAIGLVLRGAAAWLPWVTPAAALHALTVGGVGMLTLGMMARVALGHTGRMLAVKPIVGVAFALVALSAILRVAGTAFGPTAAVHSMLTAGTLFAVAFAIYAVVYAPILLSSRVDGRPG